MQKLAAVWGVGGILIMLSSAVYRLSFYAADSLLGTYKLHGYHWLILVVGIVFMLYSEGYKGFQKAFSPRVAARAKYLSRNASLIHGLFAPFFCMAYFHSTKKRMIVSWSVTTAVICLIIIVRALPQPLRGIIDTAVLLGLSYGIVTVMIYCYKAFIGKDFNYSPEIPEHLQ